MSIKLALQKVFEKKMSDAKDLLDEALNEKLALHLSEKKLDPVGKEDGDIDNDGDEDDTDSYLLNRRKKIGQAMKKEDMQYEGIKMTPTPPMQKKKKTRKANKSGDKVVKRDSRSFNFKKVNDDEEIKEGAPDTELDHHKGKNPDIFDQDYLPMKKNMKKMKAVNTQSSGGY
jgi:hypothetical protein